MSFVKLFLLVFYLYVNEIFAIYSGLYVDNEEGQTIREVFNSAQEKVAFERNMLEFLGLHRKPRKIYSPEELEISAPKFLLDIYNALDGDIMVDNEFNLKMKDMQAVEESDTIMSFLARNDRGSVTRHEKGRRLWFDVRDIRVGDTLLNAELRLYKLYDDGSTNNYTVTVHEVLDTLNEGQKLEYVDAVNVTGDYEGWIVLNVSSALTNWVVFPSANKGLYLSVNENSKPFLKIHPENIGIISSISFDENQQPFVVAYLNSERAKMRRVREVSSSRNKHNQFDKRSSKLNDPFSVQSNRVIKSCHLQTLYVNFKDLNWTEWIISPPGYSAHYCSGVCEFPLNQHMNATNHAIVQTLVLATGAWNDNNIPPPACCVPTKLISIKVLFFTQEEAVVLKKWSKMSAKSCGCH